MARLSNYTREKMAGALAAHRYQEAADGLIAESRALFGELYDLHHDADTRKHIAAIVKRHPDGFEKVDTLTANVGGQRIRVGEMRLAGGEWRVEIAYRPALRDADQYSGVSVDAASALGARIVAFGMACETLSENVATARREALSALAQFSTGKKLAEEWPEAMPVIGALIPEDDRTLPVVQVSNLNRTFGLPPADRKAA